MYIILAVISTLALIAAFNELRRIRVDLTERGRSGLTIDDMVVSNMMMKAPKRNLLSRCWSDASQARSSWQTRGSVQKRRPIAVSNFWMEKACAGVHVFSHFSHHVRSSISTN